MGKPITMIESIGPAMKDKLSAAGVTTVHAALVKTQEEKGLTRVVPAASKVADFVEQAKTLEPIVTY